MKDFFENKEEFIWAIRQRHETSQSAIVDQTELNENNRRKKCLTDLSMVQDRQSLIMASLVPDEVIQNVDDYNPRELTGCVLFGDITGFTELCENYNKSGKGGPSRITAVLNSYLGAMVQEVMSNGGDVVKFSGDAFLVVWKCEENFTLRDYVHKALDCALVIQKNYGTYETDIGVYLRVKLAVAAGKLVFSLIGDQHCSHYLYVGRPINDVKQAERMSNAGEIIVAPSAWYNVNNKEYLAVNIKNSFMRVDGIGSCWRRIEDPSKEDKFPISSIDLIEACDQNDEGLSESEDTIEQMNESKEEDFSLRPCLYEASSKSEQLKKFIIEPLLAAIKKNEPMESLIELRYVAIAFANIVVKKESALKVIQVIDMCYKIICGYVSEYNGCVNKVSLFDKDIMVLFVFGLRGFSNELQCQQALKCSANILKDVQNIPLVSSVSIACTAGKSYCGIVGHTLRREYTVISATVNKAARLVMAYPNMVTCDRQTFVQSKMEAKHFVLQVSKPLKGIADPGHVYEFKEIERVTHSAMSNQINVRPTLGRDFEINLYKKLLNQYMNKFDSPSKLNTIECPDIKMLIVEGYPRQGKTRLLDEFVYCTESNVDIIRISLRSADKNKPYQTIKSLFAPTMRKDKAKISTETLIRKLERFKRPQLFCALNEIFNVRFAISEQWRSYDEHQKFVATTKVVRYLSKVCFTTPWVVAIDNADYIDEMTWALLPYIIDIGAFFLVVTMHREMTNPVLKKLKRSKSVQRIALNNIDKLFHGAIACQMLNVYALPADLENVIQSNSNGNPGWIDCFLITLLQGNKIFIQKRDHQSIFDYGLVAPPLYMMHRLSEEKINMYKKVLEEKTIDYSSSSIANYFDKWHIYIDMCRDKAIDVETRRVIHKTLFNEEQISVCLMDTKCGLKNDVDSEISEDIMMLQLFDSLNYNEQYLLKCSSTLGDTFNRKLLAHVLRPETERSFAEVVQQLFEKGVLCCAHGDFSNGGEYVLLRDKIVDPSKDDGPVDCYCRGLNIDDSCYTLPVYASCGFLRFKFSKFRITTYNLLPDAQKKEFHSKAAKYLTQETRKCVSCGGGYFTQIETSRMDQRRMHQHYQLPKRKQITLDQMNFDELLSYSASSTLGPKSSHFSSISGWKMRQSYHSIGSYSYNSDGTSSRKDYPEDYSSYARKLTVLSPFMIFRISKRLSLTKTFSQIDFTNCECHLILSAMYGKLKDHYKGAGNYLEMIDTICKYSKVSIGNNNFSAAMHATKEGIAFIENSRKLINLPDWEIRNLQGKLYMIKGIVLFNTGQKEKAYEMFLQAMSYFGYPFPRKKISVVAKLWNARLKLRLGLYLLPDIFTGKNLTFNEAETLNNISECLLFLHHLFMEDPADHASAEVAATWALTLSLESESSLACVCDAFAIMIAIARRKRNRLLRVALETHALRFCHRRRVAPDVADFNAIARLYAVVCETRAMRADYQRAVYVGHIALDMSRKVNGAGVATRIMPLIIMGLIVRLQLEQATAMLQELAYISEVWECPMGKTWYYTLTLLFHLETGYMLIPIQSAQMFFYGEGFDKTSSLTKNQLRFILALWVWFLRNERWEAAAILKESLEKFDDRKLLTIDDPFLLMYWLEGHLLYLVSKINRRNIWEMNKTKSKLTKMFKRFFAFAKFVPVIYGRLYLLRAYFACIVNDEDKMKLFLDKAKRKCTKFGNNLEMMHIEHSAKAWNNELQSSVRDFWKNHCSSDNFADYRDFREDDVKVFTFTYPLPLFEN